MDLLGGPLLARRRFLSSLHLGAGCVASLPRLVFLPSAACWTLALVTAITPARVPPFLAFSVILPITPHVGAVIGVIPLVAECCHGIAGPIEVGVMSWCQKGQKWWHGWRRRGDAGDITPSTSIRCARRGRRGLQRGVRRASCRSRRKPHPWAMQKEGCERACGRLAAQQRGVAGARAAPGASPRLVRPCAPEMHESLSHARPRTRGVVVEWPLRHGAPYPRPRTRGAVCGSLCIPRAPVPLPVV